VALAIAAAKSIEIAPPSKKRRLKWTCRYCGHTFSTWTRRGLRVTCRNPKCGRVQEGPAGIELMAERLGKLQPARSAAAQPLQVVAVTPKRRAAPVPKARAVAAKTPPRPAAGAGNGKAKASPLLQPPAPVPPAPPAARVGLVDRLMFGVRG